MNGLGEELSKAWLMRLDCARSLEQLGHETLKILFELRDIQATYLSPLEARLIWTNGEEQTLQAAANLIGVTRERIRQVQKKLEPLVVPVPIGPRVLYSVLAILRRAQTLDEFWSEAINEGIAERPWPSAAVTELIAIYGRDELVEEWEGSVDRLTPPELDTDTRRRVRQYRNKIGMIDLAALSEDFGVEPIQARSVVEGMYAHVRGNGKLVLAHQRVPGPFLAALVRQLKIVSPLSSDVLAEGIRREANANSTPMVGDRASLVFLIQEIAGSPGELTSFPDDIQKGVQLNSGEMWLKQVMRAAPGGILHRDQISTLAIEEEVNLGSVMAYLSTSPIIRTVIPGVFTLVGTDVSERDAEVLRSSVISQAETIEINNEWISGNILRLSVRVNMGLIVGGSLSLRKNIRELVSAVEFEQSCECGHLKTVSRVKIVPSGFWANVSPMLTHAASEHGLVAGDWARLDLDFFNSRVTLRLTV